MKVQLKGLWLFCVQNAIFSRLIASIMKPTGQNRRFQENLIFPKNFLSPIQNLHHSEYCQNEAGGAVLYDGVSGEAYWFVCLVGRVPQIIRRGR